MSHANVERIIGVLVTDEAVRDQFTRDPSAVLQRLADSGYPLTPCERSALETLDPGALVRFAEGLDARLQKSDLRSGARNDLPAASPHAAGAEGRRVMDAGAPPRARGGSR